MTKLLPAARGTPFPESPADWGGENENDKTAFDYFKSKGLTDAQAAGIVGNLDQESNMNPTAKEYDDNGNRLWGTGIAQWNTGARWDKIPGDNVVDYAHDHGEDEWSLNTQLDFLWYELQGPYKGCYDALTKDPNVSVEDATFIFEQQFESPNATKANLGKRLTYAQAAFAAFGGSRRLMGGEDSVRVGAGQQPAAHVDTPDSGGGMVAEGHPTVFVGEGQLPFARVGDPTKIRDGTIVEGDDTVLLGGEPGSSQSGIEGPGQ